MKIKSLRLALEQAATRSTQPGRAPASIFVTGSTRAKTNTTSAGDATTISSTRERPEAPIKI